MKIILAVAMLLASGSVALARTPSLSAASVDRGGKLLSGNAVAAQENLDLGGTYYVAFRHSVEGCTAVATVTGTGTTPTEGPAIVTTGPARNAPTTIAVQIREPGGKLVSRGFSLIVTCF